MRGADVVPVAMDEEESGEKTELGDAVIGYSSRLQSFFPRDADSYVLWWI